MPPAPAQSRARTSAAAEALAQAADLLEVAARVFEGRGMTARALNGEAEGLAKAAGEFRAAAAKLRGLMVGGEEETTV